MSLEAAIEKNTEALNKLISVLANMPVPASHVGAPAPADPHPGDTPKVEAPKDEAPTLSYDEDVRKPFLALLNAKRDAAMKLLADLGVPNLKGYEGKPETYPDLVKKIKEAANG